MGRSRHKGSSFGAKAHAAHATAKKDEHTAKPHAAPTDTRPARTTVTTEDGEEVEEVSGGRSSVADARTGPREVRLEDMAPSEQEKMRAMLFEHATGMPSFFGR
jgi:hypothetical protein